VTDAELNDRFQRTALYASLKSILPKRSQRAGCDLPPPQALGVPTATEIAARWPTMDAEGVAAVLQSYQSESERVGKLGLEHVYDRVKELVEHDIMWG
jgi:nuclear pore complex protein Nup133